MQGLSQLELQILQIAHVKDLAGKYTKMAATFPATAAYCIADPSPLFIAILYQLKVLDREIPIFVDPE